MIVRIRIVLIVLLAAATCTLATPVRSQSYDFELVAKLCGKLEQIDRTPDKRIPGKYSTKYLPVKNARLMAYERNRGTTCCKTAKLVGEIRSSSSGTFEFKGLQTGDYWLVAAVEQQEYQMAVRVQQLRDKQPVCKQMSFAIGESGEFQLRFRT